MKVSTGFLGMDVSAKGMSIQRKKMTLVAENIASADSLRTDSGLPYKRKFLEVTAEGNGMVGGKGLPNINVMGLKTSNNGHIQHSANANNNSSRVLRDINTDIKSDASQGELSYMPEHPDADENGYVEMSNVSVIHEMVEMINATRSFEANVTAFNASKQIAKDSLEI